MTVKRPTFHEAWYRVADLCPRLPNSIEVYRQDFRGQLWYVLENPVNNQFSRISVEAYRFIALLDGRRTVSEAWRICTEQLGDQAPTQGEVIQLLGQLYTTNLLLAELAPDTANLFNRYRKRIKRQIQSYLTNLLFIRVPIFDPEHFLNRWIGLVGKLYSWWGFVLWVLMLSVGIYYVVGNFGELYRRSAFVLAGDNLILLYLTFAAIKVLHEFNHSFACKKFGIAGGTGGQVHVMGIMFLVFTPVPYMDASSAWAFRNKRHRVIVGSAGVMMELFCAAIAVVVWANTSVGLAQTIAYNVIFVASVSSLIFNGNPLLRFDAYYVLADLLEIPNLSQRSKNYLHYLVKRWCWGIKHAVSPANSRWERVWFVVYGITSSLFRIYILIRILLFLNNRLPEELFILVPIFAVCSVIAWVLVPLGKFLQYMVSGPELARTRMRAWLTTAGFLGLLFVLLGVIRFRDYCRVEGVVESARLSVVYAETDGFVDEYLASDTAVAPGGASLIKAHNLELETEKAVFQAERRDLEIQQQLAQEQRNYELQQILGEQAAALDERLARVNYELASLDLDAPVQGRWISPKIERIEGLYLRRGEAIGYVADLEEMIIRATAGQNVAALMMDQAVEAVEVRVKGRPTPTVEGRILDIYPAGQTVLPSEALSAVLGGSMATQSADPRDPRTAENFFEIRIKMDKVDEFEFLSGQRVVVRVELPSQPLAGQLWRRVRQLLQRRFYI